MLGNNKKKTLLVGPDAMEYGWMLQFVARARYKAQFSDKVIVYCEKPNTFLYKDFADMIYSCKVQKGWRDRYFFRKKRGKLSKEDYPKADRFSPSKKHCLSKKAKFIQYGKKIENNFDIVFHARAIKQGDKIDRMCGGNRNWSVKKYEKLRTMFKNYTACSIGSKGGAYHVPGTEDLRGTSMEKLCDIFASAQVAIGTSSFPLHLASLCKCPHVVITHGRKEKCINATNKQRYKKLWNPFNTPCEIVEDKNWNPKVENVFNSTRRILNGKEKR